MFHYIYSWQSNTISVFIRCYCGENIDTSRLWASGGTVGGVGELADICKKCLNPLVMFCWLDHLCQLHTKQSKPRHFFLTFGVGGEDNAVDDGENFLIYASFIATVSQWSKPCGTTQPYPININARNKVFN